MADGLKIVIGADAKQAEKVLKDFVSTAQKSGTQAANAMGKSLGTVPQAIKKIETAAKPAQLAVSKLGDTLETLRAKLLAKQQFIIQEKDIAKVAILNQEMQQLEQEILRVSRAGSAGFDGLGNAITKTGGAFSGVVSAGQGAFSVLRKIAFIVPGIGIAGLVGALSDLVIGLFKSTDQLDQASVSASKFAIAMKDAEEGVKQFVDSLDFGADIKKLQNELLFGKGPKLDLLNFEVDKAKNQKIINQANTEITELTDKILAIRRDANFTLSKKGAQLLDTFFNDLEIPDNLIDDLDKKSKAVIRQIKVDATKIKALEDERLKATQENQKGELESRIKFNEDLKKVKKEKFEFDKIEPLRANIPIDFGLLLRFDKRRARDILTDEVIKTAPETYAEVRKEMEANIKRLAENNPIILETNARIKIALEKERDQAKFFKSAFSGFKLFDFPDNPIGPDGKKLFDDVTFGAMKAGAAINQTLTPAFNNMFSAIKAGDNPLKAFFEGIGQAVEQLIQKLIAAAIQAAILSALIPGGGAGKGFGSIFKGILGFASGGIVSGPTLSLIGEGRGTNSNNPEVVAPLDRLRGMLAGLGTSQPQVIMINSRVRGNSLQLLASRTNRQNGRLGAR